MDDTFSGLSLYFKRHMDDTFSGLSLYFKRHMDDTFSGLSLYFKRHMDDTLVCRYISNDICEIFVAIFQTTYG